MSSTWRSGELVEEGWLSQSGALDLVEPLMSGNARELFPILRRGAPVGA
ncbi:MAG TPA: hypothetical protein VG370_34570 [Chloroflexota bacterium]|nr:hypothetical protein [Chloroflexota bacterium]